MSKPKRKITETYNFPTIGVKDFSASVTSCVSHKVRDKRQHWQDPRVYDCYTNLEILGILTSPRDREGHCYELSVYGDVNHVDQYATKLSDCHARDDNGLIKYRKARGRELPIYDFPNGIGYHERRRGTQIWTGAVWVPPQSVTNMLALLASVRPLYLHIHERKIDRKKFIVGVTLQTSDPEKE